MIRWLSAFFFGCFHSRTSFPITVKRRTYVTCLNCGVEIPYSWTRMKLGCSDPAESIVDAEVNA